VGITGRFWLCKEREVSDAVMVVRGWLLEAALAGQISMCFLVCLAIWNIPPHFLGGVEKVEKDWLAFMRQNASMPR
jgi:hypothetical protein